MKKRKKYILFGAIFLLIIGIIRARGGLFRIIKDNILKSNWFAFLMKFLFDYNIKKESTVFLVLRQRGGGMGSIKIVPNFAAFARKCKYLKIICRKFYSNLPRC